MEKIDRNPNELTRDRLEQVADKLEEIIDWINEHGLVKPLLKACYFSEITILEDNKIEIRCVPTGLICDEKDFHQCNLFQELYGESVGHRRDRNMEAETVIYEKAIVEARKGLGRTGGEMVKEVDGILQQAQEDIDKIKQMRQIAQEEIKKVFGEV